MDTSEKSAQRLKQELCRDQQAIGVHRAHAVYFALNGYEERGIARMFNVDIRTLRRWIAVFADFGTEALVDAQHSGRPATLTNTQWKAVQRVLRVKSPTASGPSLSAANRRSAMTGDALAAYIKGKFDIVLSVRQCQRLIAKARALRNQENAR